MLPKKELNIYPKSDENLQALIAFYFDKYDIGQENGIEILRKKTSLKLNQVEFLVSKLSEAFEPIFRKHLSGTIEIENLLKYGFDALEKSEPTGSKTRNLITEEFRHFLTNQST